MKRKSKYSISKPTWWFVIAGITIISTPIIINSIVMTTVDIELPFDLPFIKSEVSSNNQWVGFFSSYIGGIIGGVISGGMTLKGVLLNIEKDKIAKLIDEYPQKKKTINSLEKVLDEINVQAVDTFHKNLWSEMYLYEKGYDFIAYCRKQEAKIIEECNRLNGIVLLGTLRYFEELGASIERWETIEGELHKKTITEKQYSDRTTDEFNSLKFQWIFYYQTLKKENRVYDEKMKELILKNL